MAYSTNSDLKYLYPLWEHEFIESMRDTEFERLLRGDQDLGPTPGLQKVVGDHCLLAQDVINALIVRQQAL